MAEAKKGWEEILHEDQLDESGIKNLSKPDIVKLATQLKQRAVETSTETDIDTLKLQHEEAINELKNEHQREHDEQINQLKDNHNRELKEVNDKLENLQTKFTESESKAKLYSDLKVSHSNLETTVENRESEKQELLVKLNQATAELEEKDKLYQNALGLLSSNESSDTHEEQLAQVLILTEQCLIKVLDHLPNKAEWSHKVIDSVSKLGDSDVLDVINAFDLVLIVLGTRDVTSGTPRVFQKLKFAIKKMESHGVPIVVSQLPPVLNGEKTIKIDVFNYDLINKKIENTGVITLNKTLTRAPKNEILGYDGMTLNDKGGKIMADLIIGQLEIPPASDRVQQKQPCITMECDHNKENITMMMHIKPSLVGAVIGSKGETVKDLSETHKVKVSIGMWAEKKKNEEEPKFERNGAIITGKIDNILSAKRAIDNKSKKTRNH